jgi:hypothetical protein
LTGISQRRYGRATTGNSSGRSAAIARISSVIFIEQYFGPHVLQKWALLGPAT